MAQKRVDIVSSENSNVRHVVVAHSQASRLWDVSSPERDNLPFKLEFIVVHGGRIEQLVDIVKQQVHLSLVNGETMYITAMLWQNSIQRLTIANCQSIIQDLESYLQAYPHCKVALPTMMYVPDLEDFFPKIAELNQLLTDYQVRNNMTPYMLCKVGKTDSPKGYRCIPSFWQEYLNNRSKGYHLSEPGKEMLVKYISLFHRHVSEGPGKPRQVVTGQTRFRPPVVTVPFP